MLKLKRRFMTESAKHDFVEEYELSESWAWHKKGKRKKPVDVWVYDDKLKELFAKSEIVIGKRSNYNESKCEKHGEYAGVVELKQKGKSYLIPVYSTYDKNWYGFALFERVKA